MKMDKEALLKHKFWIVLGTFAVLWLVALTWLLVSAGGPIEAAKKKYKDPLGTITGFQRPMNPSFIKPWEDDKKVFQDHKKVIWADAFAKQEKLYTFPGSREYDFAVLCQYPSKVLNTQQLEKFKEKDFYD